MPDKISHFELPASDADKSKKFYTKVDISPNDAQLWSNKGAILSDLKDYEEALKCYDKALEIDPNYAQAWFNKGVVLADLEKYRDALLC